MKGVRKGFSLSDEEVGFLQGRLKVLKGKKHRELRARIYAILLVGGPEMAKHDDVAHRCKVHVRTVRDWLARYREGGFEGLKDKPLSGRPCRLGDEAKVQLKEIISKSPEEAGYDTGIWTSSLVKQLISERFGVDFSLNNVCYILKQLGCSFKLPQKKQQVQTLQNSRNGWIVDSPG